MIQSEGPVLEEWNVLVMCLGQNVNQLVLLHQIAEVFGPVSKQLSILNHAKGIGKLPQPSGM